MFIFEFSNYALFQYKTLVKDHYSAQGSGYSGLDNLSNSQKKEHYEKKLKIYLLPKDEADSKNAILEIRAGTGGLEATLFVADLYKMYEKVCLNKNWSFEIINISKSEAGGYKEVIATWKNNVGKVWYV